MLQGTVVIVIWFAVKFVKTQEMLRSLDRCSYHSAPKFWLGRGYFAQDVWKIVNKQEKVHWRSLQQMASHFWIMELFLPIEYSSPSDIIFSGRHFQSSVHSCKVPRTPYYVVMITKYYRVKQQKGYYHLWVYSRSNPIMTRLYYILLITKKKRNQVYTHLATNRYYNLILTCLRQTLSYTCTPILHYSRATFFRAYFALSQVL